MFNPVWFSFGKSIAVIVKNHEISDSYLSCTTMFCCTDSCKVSRRREANKICLKQVIVLIITKCVFGRCWASSNVFGLSAWALLHGQINGLIEE